MRHVEGIKLNVLWMYWILKFLQLIVDGLARILCMTNPSNTCAGARVNVVGDTECELQPVEVTERMGEDPVPNMDGTSGSPSNIENLLLAILNIYRMEHRMKTENEQENGQKRVAELEWRQVASVLDRVLIYVYVAVIIASLIMFFPRRAYWYRWQLFSKKELLMSCFGITYLRYRGI